MPAPAATSGSTSHRGRRWIILAAVILVVLVLSLHTFAVFYTDALWFSSQLDGDVARPYLIAALRDPSAEVVADACSRLADVGGADAQPALLAVMTNPDSTPALAAAAASALEATDGELARQQAAAIAHYRDAATPAEQGATDEPAAADD